MFGLIASCIKLLANIASYFKNLQLVRQGRNKEKLERLKSNERARKDADKVKDDVATSSITDLRKWLRDNKRK